jgi:hypothetical protein
MAPKSIKRVVKRYLKKISGNRNDCVACESYLQPVIPPAPLTGDVGRDCGDASRALLFCLVILVEFPFGTYLAHTLAHTRLGDQW